jgi:GTP pyrophosphokinase
MSERVPHLSERMSAAFDMARDVHNGQTLKGTDLPYLLHLLDVCSIALRHGADEDQAIAALLHDVVEDGGGMAKAEEIGDLFGERVRDTVLACSDSVVDDPSAKRPWWDRKIEYVDHLVHASSDAAFVTGADKLSNVRSLVTEVAEHGDDYWARFSGGRVGSLWYYRMIAAVLPERLPPIPGAELLGRRYRDAVDALIDVVGPGQAEFDWHAALELEAAARARMDA